MMNFMLGERVVALGYGLVCAAAFGAGVLAMIAGLYSGMQTGFGPWGGSWLGWGLNVVLVLQFPVVHSWLLSRGGGSWLSRWAPGRLGKPLATTLYVIAASLQVGTVFALWSPSGVVWWEATGWAYGVSVVAYAVSWLLVVKTMGDAGLGTQMGLLGWTSVARGRPPAYGSIPVAGSFRWCRQPIYAAFALTLWTGPVWTPDRVGLALVWTGYCYWGPRLKERRYVARYGAAYQRYQASVPYWIPQLRGEGRAV